jgi:hypothetical protein
MLNKLRGLVVRVGRRGSFLLFLALIDFVYGWSLISITNPALAVIHLFPSSLAWGIAWIMAGVICLVEAFAIWDRLAFSLSVLIQFLWGMQMFVAWFNGSNPYGWITATVFLGFAMLTGIVSFWPEQRRFKVEDR